MKKKKSTLIACGAAVLFLLIALFINGSSNAKAEPKQQTNTNYKTINDVAGVSFYINETIANKATAISEISEKIDVEPNLFYVYKDGKSKYLLFCLNSIIVAVEKDTSFHFSEYENKKDAISNSSVSGIWFEQNGNKFVGEEKGSKYIANVNAGLVITNDIYNDYVGQLAVLSDGETEWAIFAGVPGTTKFKDLPDDTKKGIQNIVQSLSLSDYVEEIPTESYAVVIGTGETEKVDLVEETVEPTEEEIPEEPDTVKQPGETLETEIIETEENVEATETAENEIPSVEENAEEENAVSEENESEENKDIENREEESLIVEEEAPDEPVKEEESSAQETKPSVETPQKKVIQLNNQKKIENKADDRAYTSDVYSMLKVRDNGIIKEYNYETRTFETPIIRIQKIITGKAAENIIKEYCENAKAYNYFEAPEGCSWQVAEYYLSYQGCNAEPYIDIKMKGIDGNPLKFRGISYSQRTYDIFYKAENTGNFYGPYYCYYAVPNGCVEYALECGTGNISSDIEENNAAYYLIRQ